jgi:plasmid stabilization system protein ParE
VTWKLIVGPEAESEIAAAQDWYDGRIPGLGAEFVAALSRVIATIAENPFQYQIVWKNYRRAVLRRFPYLVIHVVSGDAVRVVACIHGQRDPEVWQERADEA